MKIAVVIPCYRVRAHVLRVIEAIGPEVSVIYAVDDACPENSGDYIEGNVSDPRVCVLRHSVNEGVGAALVTGYRQALADDMDIIVKIDGDGQMDPALLPAFARPIIAGHADYTKGNRFFDVTSIEPMPLVRILGNAGLSFLSKVSTGYWDIFDPTNGYTAIHASVLETIPLDKVSPRYFFESDMLFRLGTVRARVLDIPMRARYRDEVSSLSVKKAMIDFSYKHMLNFFKRIFYNYFLRNFSVASVELVLGILLFGFGVLFGSIEWAASIERGIPATAGTVMIAGISLIAGLQLLLAFLSFDMGSSPRTAIWPHLAWQTSGPLT